MGKDLNIPISVWVYRECEMGLQKGHEKEALRAPWSERHCPVTPVPSQASSLCFVCQEASLLPKSAASQVPPGLLYLLF